MIYIILYLIKLFIKRKWFLIPDIKIIVPGLWCQNSRSNEGLQVFVQKLSFNYQKSRISWATSFVSQGIRARMSHQTKTKRWAIVARLVATSFWKLVNALRSYLSHKNKSKIVLQPSDACQKVKILWKQMKRSKQRTKFPLPENTCLGHVGFPYSLLYAWIVRTTVSALIFLHFSLSERCARSDIAGLVLAMFVQTSGPKFEF